MHTISVTGCGQFRIGGYQQSQIAFPRNGRQGGRDSKTLGRAEMPIDQRTAWRQAGGTGDDIRRPVRVRQRYKWRQPAWKTGPSGGQPCQSGGMGIGARDHD